MYHKPNPDEKLFYNVRMIGPIQILIMMQKSIQLQMFMAIIFLEPLTISVTIMKDKKVSSNFTTLRVLGSLALHLPPKADPQLISSPLFISNI